MGQRLVVDIIRDDEIVAAIYYHWSAYFASTIMELANLSEAILEADKNGTDKLLAIVEKLEEKEEHTDIITGELTVRRGGLCGGPEIEKELEAAKKLLPDHEFATENISRNCGIISFTDEGIKSFHYWEEGHATIDLDTLEIQNSVEYDAYPFEIPYHVEKFKDGKEYETYAESGIVTINGNTCPVDAFDCNCKTIIDLANFMDREYKAWRIAQRKDEIQ